MYYHWNPPLTEGDKGGTVYQDFLKVKPDAKFGETYTLGTGVSGPKGGKYGLGNWGYAGEALVITTNTNKDPRKLDTILSMLDSFYGDENYARLISSGIKDKDYKVDSTGNTTSLLKTPAEERTRGLSVFNFLGGNPETVKKDKKATYEFADKFKGPILSAPAVPSVEAQAQYMANLQKLFIESYIKIISAEKSIDYFDEFVKTFRANGGDELEKQYTEVWKSLGGQ